VPFAVLSGALAAAIVIPTSYMALTLLGMIAAAIIVRSRLDSGTLAVVFLAVVAAIPAQLVVPGLGSLGSPQIIVSLAALGAWFVTWLSPNDNWADRYRPVPILIAIFVAANLASFGAAGLRPTDALESSAADRGLIIVLASAGIALLIAESVSSRDRLDVVVKGMVLAGTAIACVGIIQFASGYDLAANVRLPGLQSTTNDAAFITTRSIFRRVSGTTVHAIEFSAVLCIVFPAALYLALYQRRRWFISVALIGIALPMSVSRTAVVGIGIGALVLVLAWPRSYRRKFYAFTVLYLVAMRLMIPGLLGTIRALFVDAGADPSVSSRTTDYEYVDKFVAERPLFGRGFATFIPTRYDFLDNQYLLSLVETGYVGVSAYLLLLAGGMFVAYRVRRRSTDDRDRGLAQALMASLAVVGFTSFTFDFLSFPTARAMLFTAVGCVGALWRFTSDAATTAPNRRSPQLEVTHSTHVRRNNGIGATPSKALGLEPPR
jgi:O-antigen ligase